MPINIGYNTTGGGIIDLASLQNQADAMQRQKQQNAMANIMAIVQAIQQQKQFQQEQQLAGKKLLYDIYAKGQPTTYTYTDPNTGKPTTVTLQSGLPEGVSGQIENQLFGGLGLGTSANQASPQLTPSIPGLPLRHTLDYLSMLPQDQAISPTMGIGTPQEYLQQLGGKMTMPPANIAQPQQIQSLPPNTAILRQGNKTSVRTMPKTLEQITAESKARAEGAAEGKPAPKKKVPSAQLSSINQTDKAISRLKDVIGFMEQNKLQTGPTSLRFQRGAIPNIYMQYRGTGKEADFKSRNERFINEYITAQTGAQRGFKEMEWLGTAIPNPAMDTPENYLIKAKQTLMELEENKKNMVNILSESGFEVGDLQQPQSDSLGIR